MKCKVSIVVLVLAILLALVQNVGASAYWDNHNATGIDNIWDSLGMSYLKNSTILAGSNITLTKNPNGSVTIASTAGGVSGMSNPATADLNMGYYNISNVGTPFCSGASYCIFNQSGTIIAVNGSTQNVDYSGTPMVVLKSVINNSVDTILSTHGTFTLTSNIGDLKATNFTWLGYGTTIRATNTGANSEVLKFVNSPKLKLYGLDLDGTNNTYRQLAILRDAGQNADDITLKDITIRNQIATSNAWGFIIWDRENARNLRNINIENFKGYNLLGMTNEAWIISLARDVNVNGLYLDNIGYGASLYRSLNSTISNIIINNSDSITSTASFYLTSDNAYLSNVVVPKEFRVSYSVDELVSHSNNYISGLQTNKIVVIGNQTYKMSDTTFLNPSVKGSSGSGVVIQNYANNTKIIGGTIEGSLQHGIDIQANSRDSQMIGVTVKNNNVALGDYGGINNNGINTSVSGAYVYDDNTGSQNISYRSGTTAAGKMYITGGRITGSINENTGKIYMFNVVGYNGYPDNITIPNLITTNLTVNGVAYNGSVSGMSNPATADLAMNNKSILNISRIGIGSNDPDASIEIRNTTSGFPAIRFLDPGINEFRIGQCSANYGSGYDTKLYVVNTVGGKSLCDDTNRGFIIDADGKMMIGNSTKIPLDLLHVYRANDHVSIRIEQFGSNEASMAWAPSGQNGNGTLFNVTNPAWGMGLFSIGASPSLKIVSAVGTPNNSTITSRITVNPNGFVGMGVTDNNILADLHVENATGAKIRVGGNINSAFEFLDAGTSINIPASNTIAFNTSGVERMRISNTGIVTVGTGVVSAVGAVPYHFYNGTNNISIGANVTYEQLTSGIITGLSVRQTNKVACSGNITITNYDTGAFKTFIAWSNVINATSNGLSVPFVQNEPLLYTMTENTGCKDLTFRQVHTKTS